MHAREKLGKTHKKPARTPIEENSALLRSDELRKLYETTRVSQNTRIQLQSKTKSQNSKIRRTASLTAPGEKERSPHSVHVTRTDPRAHKSPCNVQIKAPLHALRATHRQRRPPLLHSIHGERRQRDDRAILARRREFLRHGNRTTQSLSRQSGESAARNSRERAHRRRKRRSSSTIGLVVGCLGNDGSTGSRATRIGKKTGSRSSSEAT